MSPRLTFRSRIRGARRAKPGPRIAIATISVTILLAGCGTPAETEPSSLRIGLDRVTFDLVGSPLDGKSLGYFGGTAIYEGLIGWDPIENDFIPWLAEEYTLAEDRKSMTLKLRTDVDFIDGEHLDAQAVADFLDIAMASDGATLGPAVKETYQIELEVQDEYTLEITTAKTMTPEFFFYLRDQGIASPVAAQDPEGLKAQAAGTGPYLIEDAVPETSISFVRNEDYWNPDLYEFDELEYLAFDDRIAASNALKSGQVDVAQIDASLAANVEGDGFDLSIGGGDYQSLITLDYTGEVTPALGDVRVRQAIMMAIDGEAIIESLEHGYGFLSDQPFAVGQAEYLEGQDDVYSYDVEAAKALMAEAGYADGFDVVIPSSDFSTIYPAQLEPIVQQMLGEIGIRVTYETFTDLGALIGAWSSGNYPLILIWPSYENTLGILVTDPPLFGHFQDDPAWAGLVDDVQNGSLEESGTARAELGQYMLDQAWFAPILHPALIWASNDRVDFTMGRYSFVNRLSLFTKQSGN